MPDWALRKALMLPNTYDIDAGSRYDRQDTIRPTGGYAVVTIANGLFAVVMIVAMLTNGASAITAVITSAIYYSATTLPALLILSGSLSDIVTHRQREVTQRRVIELQFAALIPPAPALIDVDPDPTPSPPGVGGVGGVSTYVPARAPTDDSTRREAVAFALQLYAGDGLPDPKKVIVNTDRERPGRIRIAMPGKAARQYLIDRAVVVDLGNGFRVNLTRYPTLTALRPDLR